MKKAAMKLKKESAMKLKKSGMMIFSLDRKSTRLNSSHLVISYAVFCLKKKKVQADAVIRSWQALYGIIHLKAYADSFLLSMSNHTTKQGMVI